MGLRTLTVINKVMKDHKKAQIWMDSLNKRPKQKKMIRHFVLGMLEVCVGQWQKKFKKI
jgi:hypothetical protein